MADIVSSYKASRQTFIQKAGLSITKEEGDFIVIQPVLQILQMINDQRMLCNVGISDNIPHIYIA